MLWAEQAQGLPLMKFAEVYWRLRCKVLRQAEAAEALGMSERNFRGWQVRSTDFFWRKNTAPRFGTPQ